MSRRPGRPGGRCRCRSAYRRQCLRLLRRGGPRVRHHPAGHADAVAELHRRGPLRRHRLQHRRRLLLRPRSAQPARDALSLQLDPRRPARALRLLARPGYGRVLEPDRLAGEARSGSLRMPPRHRVYKDRQPLPGHRGRGPVLRSAESRRRARSVRALACCGSKTPARPLDCCAASATPSSASPTRSTT